MALMKFREPNQVAWYGSRPAHRGTAIHKKGEAVNTTDIIHTVTALKTFYLTEWHIGLYSGSANAYYSMFVRDVADALDYYIFRGLTPLNAPAIPGLHVWPPYEIPAGYDVVVISASAAHHVIGTIHGWEE